MDHKSFDRLSVVVDRLRTGATRRDTLRLLLGGSLAAAAAVTAEDAEAKRKKNKKKRNKNSCRGWGSGCSRNSDCCNGRCRSRVCQPRNGNWWNGGGGGSGRRCNTQWGTITCLPGYECSKVAGVHVCTPKGFDTCCGNNCFNNNWNAQCCNNNSWGNKGGCPAGMRCCSGQLGGGCCPDGFNCSNNGQCTTWRTASSGQRTAETRPQTPKIAFSDADWVEVTPGEGVAMQDGKPAKD
jgi:hypothetical protein